MAYAALVRYAGSSGLNIDDAPEEALSLAWYCIQLLLDTIHFEKHRDIKGKGKEDDISSEAAVFKERLYRLYLTLISAVPSLPLVLMFRALDEIKIIITSLPSSSSESISATPTASASASTRGTYPVKMNLEGSTRGELVKALYDEILNRIGYREKGAMMRWWYDNRADLQGAGIAIQTSEKAARYLRCSDGWSTDR
jgi:hypothetical protein